MKKFTLALLSLLLVPLGMMAQSVTVSPSSGNFVAAVSESSQEVGFQRGWSAMWRHEQLPLNFVTSDETTLTEGGEIAIPAGNMNSKDGNLLLIGGSIDDSYFVLSLPKGYRFKGYKITMQNDMNGESYANFDFDSSTKSFEELDGSLTGEVLVTTGEMASTNETVEYSITRMSKTDNDMSNQLYFHLNRGNKEAFCCITVTSFTVYFTAEGTFDAAITPMKADVAKSLVMSPFKTNKIDIGAVESRRVYGQDEQYHTYYGYSYENVTDLSAYTYIYQEDAIQDGVPLDVAETKKIHPVTIGGKNYFAFENGVYYAEAPTQVYTPTGLSAPIGYRIVGADFNADYGTATSGTSVTRDVYYIRYRYGYGGNYYYLNNQLAFARNNQFGWVIDERGNIQDPSTGQYLACYGEGDTRTLSWSTDPDGRWNLRRGQVGGNTYYIYYLSDGGNYYYLQSSVNDAGTPYVIKNGTSDRVSSTSGTQTYTTASYTPGAYTLSVYDKTGTSVPPNNTISVNGTGSTGTINVDEYNNDAVKFEISGLAEGQQALVEVSLSMQALNPYIDNMNLVCHDPDNQLSLSQQFTAEDFSVGGETFNFAIPSTYSETDLTFTFSDLYSSYGDNTYYTGTSLEQDGVARYSFVTSPYFTPINGNGNDGLYATGVYDPDHTYTEKVVATTAGNIRFRFNNADELLNTNPTPLAINYLKEFPFSVSAYLDSTDPDAEEGTTAEAGAFEAVILNAKDAASGTYYVFTADETRYNIAPSKAWQHRYYAFYRLAIELNTQTYEPVLTWNKVYNETCYYGQDGSDASDSMWGLKLGTVLEGTTTSVAGYLTSDEIDKAIADALDENNEDAPATTAQILYVDAGDLYSIVSSSNTGEVTLPALKAKLGTNALFYLPANTTSTLDNFAYKTSATDASFRAGKDIVLTDRQPFYAPYDIQVDIDNKVTYSRVITVPKNGKVTSATVIMPFNILVDDYGRHTSLDNNSFFLHLMQNKNCLTTGGDDAEDYVYFPVLVGATETTPNYPYLVEVENAPSDGSVSFEISQKGALIVATPSDEYVENGDYTFTGETGSGTKDGTTYTFTNHGSYSGKQLAKDGNFFYFAKGMFLRSNDFSYGGPIYMYPFRTYYSTTSTTSSAGAKALSSFNVIFGEGNGTDGVESVENDLSIDMNAPVFDLQGRKLADGLNRSNLGKGIYVISGKKIIIK